MVVSGDREGAMGNDGLNGYESSFWGGGNVLKLDSCDGCTVLNTPKCTELHFKMVNFMVY